jgi:predicted component of type VI protein secretion system
MVEAVALKKPALITITAKNQEPMVATLEAAGLVDMVGRFETVTEQQIVMKLAAVVASYEARIAQLRLQTVIDPCGPARIAQVMRDLSFISDEPGFRGGDTSQ